MNTSLKEGYIYDYMHCTDDFLDRLHVGDIVTVLPVHSCMTADLMKIYHMNDGKTAAHI